MKFNLGDIVFLKTDFDQRARVVRSILLCGTGYQYNLGCSNEDSWHYYFEISKEKDILKTF